MTMIAINSHRATCFISIVHLNGESKKQLLHITNAIFPSSMIPLSKYGLKTNKLKFIQLHLQVGFGTMLPSQVIDFAIVCAFVFVAMSRFNIDSSSTFEELDVMTY